MVSDNLFGFLLEKIRCSITESDKFLTIFISIHYGIEECDNQGCQKLIHSLFSDWFKENLVHEHYQLHNVDTNKDIIMVLNDIQLKI